MLIASALGGANTSTAVDIPHPRDLIRSQLRTFYIYGTIGGATIKIQISPDGTNWFDPTNNSFTAAGVSNFEFRAKQVRVVTSGGAGSSINVDMQQESSMAEMNKPIAQIERIQLGRGFDDLLTLAKFLMSPDGPTLLEKMEEQNGQINMGLEAGARFAEAERREAEAAAKLSIADGRLAAADERLESINARTAELLQESETLRDTAARKAHDLIQAAMDTATALQQETERQKERAAVLEGENEHRARELEDALAESAEKQADLDRRLALLRAATGD